jgi:hypothetical protein
MQLLEKYDDLNSSADPDYVPNSSNLDSTIDSTLGTDEERGKTESQMELNGEHERSSLLNNFILIPLLLFSDINEVHDSNTYSSDIERSDKSNESNASQMTELEKEIMAKILDYFKENHNFPPTNDNFPEIFYSPLGEKSIFYRYACNVICREIESTRVTLFIHFVLFPFQGSPPPEKAYSSDSEVCPVS